MLEQVPKRANRSPMHTCVKRRQQFAGHRYQSIGCFYSMGYEVQWIPYTKFGIRSLSRILTFIGTPPTPTKTRQASLQAEFSLSSTQTGASRHYLATLQRRSSIHYSIFLVSVPRCSVLGRARLQSCLSWAFGPRKLMKMAVRLEIGLHLPTGC